MKAYKVDQERLIKETPKSIIENEEVIYGSFEDSFTDLNLLDIKKQYKILPKSFNKFRLTEWEAFELDFPFGTLVSAVYNNLSLNRVGVLFYFDKETKKIYSYQTVTRKKNMHVASNLIDDDSYINTKNFKLRIKNDFKNRKARVEASIFNKKNGEFKMNIELDSFAPSSVVSIPLGKNKPLYSEKAIFKANGTLVFQGKTYSIDESATAIIDDHKGYYPYSSHYDWITTMGIINHEGKNQYFGINLTNNGSLDANKYNENNIWIEGSFFYLPPVKFFHEGDTWYIQDEYDHVNLEFKISNTFNMNVHAIVINFLYSLPFGTLNGYVKDEHGTKYIIKDMIGIGEDKTTRL